MILLHWKNLKGINKFLDINYVTKLYQDEINNSSWSITSSEVEAEIKSLRTKISPGPDGFVGELHQGFKELLPMILKIGEEGTFRSLYEVSVAPIARPKMQQQQKEKSRKISSMNLDTKFLNKALANWIQECIKNHSLWICWFYARDKGMVQNM